jgi:hypothetical protein
MTIEVPGASAEEIAAIMAAIATHPPAPVPAVSNYERWRRGRIKALATSRR